MRWIITANSTTCRIYRFDKHSSNLELVKEIDHPENRLKKSDFLTSDKPGHYRAGNSQGGAYSPHTDPKEVEIDNFSREIAHELNQGRNANAYKELVIVMPAHMSGLLFEHLDKHVQELVISKIQKDILQLPQHELLDFLHKNMKVL